MQSTSHYPMRPRTVTTKWACIQVASQGRPDVWRRAIAETAGTH